VFTAFKFKLDLTRNQTQLLESQLDSCKKLYNFFLKQRIYLYKKKGISIKKNDQQRQLPLIKLNKPEYQLISAVVLQEIVDRVDKAFKAFFRRNKTNKKGGFPRFKSRDRYNSMSFSYQAFSLKPNDTINLANIGHVKYRLTKKLKGIPKKCVIKRHKSGKYTVSIVCKIEDTPKKKPLENIVAIDLGISSFLFTSDGVGIPSLKRNEVRYKRRRHIQRALSRKKKGSNNRKKNREALTNAFEKECNTRNNMLHYISKTLIDAFDVIVVEDLKIENMMKTGFRTLHRLIQEASWGTFINYLTYKAENAGKWLIKVDPRNTSQLCSECKKIVKKPLSERIHKCPFCGLKLDRDYNASLNILDRGLKKIQELITAGEAGIYACGFLAEKLKDMINSVGQPKNATLLHPVNSI